MEDGMVRFVVGVFLGAITLGVMLMITTNVTAAVIVAIVVAVLAWLGLLQLVGFIMDVLSDL